MTLIPADTKVSKLQSDQYPEAVSRQVGTTNPFPDPILPNASSQNPTQPPNPDPHFSPPPYSETDLNSNSNSNSTTHTHTLPITPSDSASQIHCNTPISSPTPQSNAISASTSVSLTGPLHITGPVKSSSSITLKRHIKVDGKVDSSSSGPDNCSSAQAQMNTKKCLPQEHVPKNRSKHRTGHFHTSQVVL